MKITHHGDHLIQLTRWGMFNCFLVREDDALTLIDTGLSGSAKAILAAAGVEGLPITRILLTHAHVDHVGSLDALRRQLPEAEVLISVREARLLRGDHSLDPDEPQDPPRGGFPAVETEPTGEFVPGDRIGVFEMFAAPGHTPGQVAFLDTRDRTLIAGDAFTTKFGITVTGVFKLLFPFPAFATWHKPTALVTARALHALTPARLAVGHGPTLADPGAAMAQAIQTAERKFGGSS